MILGDCFDEAQLQILPNTPTASTSGRAMPKTSHARYCILQESRCQVLDRLWQSSQSSMLSGVGNKARGYKQGRPMPVITRGISLGRARLTHVTKFTRDHASTVPSQ